MRHWWRASGGNRAALPPVVANQSASFGRLTLEGAGGWEPTNTGGTISSATITTDDATNAGHWEIASGRLVPSAAGAGSLVASYTLGVTYSNSGGDAAEATITVNTVASRYSKHPGDSWSDLLTAIGTAAGGAVSVQLRDGDHGSMGTVTNQFANLVTISSENFPASITTAADWTGDAIISAVTLSATTNLKFHNVKFYKAQETEDTENGTAALVALTGTWNGLTFNRCEFASSTIAKTAKGFNWRRGIGSGSADKGKNFTASEVYFHDLSRGMVVPLDDTTTDNVNLLEKYMCDDIYQVGVMWAGGSNITARWGVIRNLFSHSGDPNGAHQSYMSYTPSQAADVHNIEYCGNVCGPMSYRQDIISIAGLKLDDLEGTGFRYVDCQIHGNLMLVSQNISVEICNAGAGSTINNNTLVYSRDLSVLGNPAVTLSGDFESLAIAECNFFAGTPSQMKPSTDGISLLTGTPETGFVARYNKVYGKISDGDSDADPTLEETFDGPFTGITSMLASFKEKAGSVMTDTVTFPPYGCAASEAYITWPAGFEDLPAAGTLIGSPPVAAAAYDPSRVDNQGAAYFTAANANTQFGADSTVLTFDALLNFQSGDALLTLLMATAGRSSISREGDNKLRVRMTSAAGAAICDVKSTADLSTAEGETHVHVKVDLGATPSVAIHFDGVDVTGTPSTLSAGTIDHSSTGRVFSLLADTDGNPTSDVIVGHLYVNTSAALDVTDFYDTVPIDPAGVGAPQILIQGAAAVFNAGTNNGSGGDFTVTGTFADAP